MFKWKYIHGSWSSGWKESLEGLLVVTTSFHVDCDNIVSTCRAEVILRVTWRLEVQTKVVKVESVLWLVVGGVMWLVVRIENGDRGISILNTGLRVCMWFLSQNQQLSFKQTGSSLIQSIQVYLKIFPWLNSFPPKSPSHKRYSLTIFLWSGLSASNLVNLYDGESMAQSSLSWKKKSQSIWL